MQWERELAHRSGAEVLCRDDGRCRQESEQVSVQTQAHTSRRRRLARLVCVNQEQWHAGGRRLSTAGEQHGGRGGDRATVQIGSGGGGHEMCDTADSSSGDRPGRWSPGERSVCTHEDAAAGMLAHAWADMSRTASRSQTFPKVQANLDQPTHVLGYMQHRRTAPARAAHRRRILPKGLPCRRLVTSVSLSTAHTSANCCHDSPATT